MSRKKDQNGISYPRMTLIGILEFEKGTKLEYSDPNWNSWGWKALIGISPFFKNTATVSAGHSNLCCMHGVIWVRI